MLRAIIVQSVGGLIPPSLPELLQVLSMNSDYIPARPIPGTIVVNIGDLMQRWTADKLVSTVCKYNKSTPLV